jgi:hypothetical protein
VRSLGARRMGYLYVARNPHVQLRCFSTIQPTPVFGKAIEDLADAITSRLTSEHRADVARFLRKAIISAIQTGHGTIIAVVNEFGKSLDKMFADGTIVQPPVDVSGRISQFKVSSGAEELGTLQTTARLMQGMLQSDGITLFSVDAKILAYRVFVQLPGSGTANPKPGGARSRTYQSLCAAVDSGVLAATFYQSQDGQSAFYRRR